MREMHLLLVLFWDVCLQMAGVERVMTDSVPEKSQLNWYVLKALMHWLSA